MPQAPQQPLDLHEASPGNSPSGSPDILRSVGLLAVSETAPYTPRNLEVNGYSYITNLPVGTNPFEEEAEVRPLQERLHPAELDKLPVGEFYVAGSETTYDDLGRPYTRELKRELVVLPSEHGKVVNTEAFTDTWTMADGMDQLMNALGFVIEERDGQPTIAAIPTPETIKNAAHTLGVDIECFPDDDLLPGRRYLGAYAQRKYPVSSKDQYYYKHDTEDDHLTAMVLGGETLKDALQDVSEEALEKDDDTIAQKARQTDAFTATLRAVIAPHHELAGEAYGSAKGRQTLIEVGLELGLPPETAEKILATAQENAKKYGIQPRELL